VFWLAPINLDLKVRREICAIRGGGLRGRDAPLLPRSCKARACSRHSAHPSALRRGRHESGIRPSLGRREPGKACPSASRLPSNAAPSSWGYSGPSRTEICAVRAFPGAGESISTASEIPPTACAIRSTSALPPGADILVAVTDFRVCRVGPGNFTPSPSQIRT